MRGTSQAVVIALVLLACGGDRAARDRLDAGEDAAAPDTANQGEPDAAGQDAETEPDEGGARDAEAPDAGEGDEPDRDSGDAQQPDADAQVDPARDLRLSGGFVRELAPLPDNAVLLTLEAPLHVRVDGGRPRRELVWIDRAGDVVRRFTLSAGRELLDSAVHASGAISLLMASDQGYAVLRLDAQGALARELPLVDAEIASDPPALPAGSSVPAIGEVTHDTGRIAAFGEDVILAVRSGRGSVIAYRYGFAAQDAALIRKYRTLVEPAVHISPTALLSGSYDTFGQLEQSYTVQLAVAPDGLAYVGVRYPEPADDTAATLHQQLFGEQLAGDAFFTDLYVTRVAADGSRLGTSVVSTPQLDELYGLRAFADAAYALGRTEHKHDQGTGHQALIARVEAGSGAVHVRELDMDRGDVAFDVLALGAGELLVVGAKDYWQNPHGASISEECAPFARLLHADGSSTALKLSSGPRHSEARSVIATEAGRLAVAGMLDGPGTHSADADSALLLARAFLIELPLP